MINKNKNIMVAHNKVFIAPTVMSQGYAKNGVDVSCIGVIIYTDDFGNAIGRRLRKLDINTNSTITVLNGCAGTSEIEAKRIYKYIPEGVKVLSAHVDDSVLLLEPLDIMNKIAEAVDSAVELKPDAVSLPLIQLIEHRGNEIFDSVKANHHLTPENARERTENQIIRTWCYANKSNLCLLAGKQKNIIWQYTDNKESPDYGIWKPQDNEDEIKTRMGEFMRSEFGLMVDESVRTNMQRELRTMGYNLFPYDADRSLLTGESNRRYIRYNDKLQLIKKDEHGIRQFVDYSPSLHITNKLPYNHSDSIDCPNFLAFLDSSLGDRDEKKLKELKLFLLHKIGQIIVGDISTGDILFLYGKGGAGKGTFMNICTAIVDGVGSLEEDNDKLNSCAVEFTQLNSEYYVSSLRGKMLNIVGESSADVQLDTNIVKMISGHDQITGREPYGSAISFKNTAVWLAASNTLPYSKNPDASMRRRLKIVKFNRSFQDEKQDRGMIERIFPEIPAIINLALKVYFNNKDKGQGKDYPVPDEVFEEVDKYLHSQDRLSSFLAENYEILEEYNRGGHDAGEWVNFSDFKNKWDIWQDGNGYKNKHWSTPRLKEAIANRGDIVVNSKRNSRWKTGVVSLHGLKAIDNG